MSAKSGVKMKQKAEPRTLLLVEDTEDNRFMMRRLLEVAGYRVVEAMNGEEAVKLAKAESPHLILMDLSLPVIDGLAATRLTFSRRRSRRAAIPTLRSPSISTSWKN